MISALLLAASLLSGPPAVGAEVKLVTGPNAQEAMVLLDGLAYVRFCKHWKADDPEGVALMVLERQAALVPRGLKVRVVEYHPGFDPPGAEVRILEGRHKSRLVWLPTFYLPRD